MNIGQTIQRDIDAAKSLFHNVEHKLSDAARETFHEAQVLASALEAKIVELGDHTGATMHIDAAVAALQPVLDSVADHVNAIVEPKDGPAKVDAPADPVAQAVMAAPPAPAPPPHVDSIDDDETKASEPIVAPIASGGSDVTA